MSIQRTFDFLDTSSHQGGEGSHQGGEGSHQDGEGSHQGGEDSHQDGEGRPRVDRRSVLQELRAKVGCIHTPPDGRVGETLSTGSEAIDRLLPRGGLRHDAITEWVGEADGCGAGSLAMISAANHLRSPRGRGPLVVVGGPDLFHPPAAVALGIPANRIIWVRPTRRADFVWAIDQSLRSQSVAAVWAFVGPHLDDRDARRFQLACEIGRTPGLLVRPAATRGRPSFADVRFHVDNPANGPGSNARFSGSHFSGRVMKVTLDRCRGGRIGRSIWVQIDDQARIDQVQPQPLDTPQQPGIPNDETATVRLASELARPKTPARKANRRRA